ncbi:hypothetical protein J6590_002174 [Homalodisca vitripennis]|nr:hypothetical protein J6590_002174 [Homalodisca vitripennis]
MPIVHRQKCHPAPGGDARAPVGVSAGPEGNIIGHWRTCSKQKYNALQVYDLVIYCEVTTGGGLLEHRYYCLVNCPQVGVSAGPEGNIIGHWRTFSKQKYNALQVYDLVVYCVVTTGGTARAPLLLSSELSTGRSVSRP